MEKERETAARHRAYLKRLEEEARIEQEEKAREEVRVSPMQNHQPGHKQACFNSIPGRLIELGAEAARG